eukprot:m.539760 g.539760  ORF g.539760 m.539760 type:complete len:315 (+) comp22092_c0_seq3:667-1611(+)
MRPGSIHVGVGTEHKVGSVQLRVLHTEVQRCAALGIWRVDVGAPGESILDRVDVAVLDGVVQEFDGGEGRFAQCLARAAARRALCRPLARFRSAGDTDTWRSDGLVCCDDAGHRALPHGVHSRARCQLQRRSALARPLVNPFVTRASTNTDTDTDRHTDTDTDRYPGGLPLRVPPFSAASVFDDPLFTLPRRAEGAAVDACFSDSSIFWNIMMAWRSFRDSRESPCRSVPGLGLSGTADACGGDSRLWLGLVGVAAVEGGPDLATSADVARCSSTRTSPLARSSEDTPSLLVSVGRAPCRNSSRIMSRWSAYVA